MPLRLIAALALLLAAAGGLVSAAGARSPAKATAEAAVVSGTLGRVAGVQASGDDSASRSAPSKTPAGIALNDGLVAVTTATAGGNASADAQAEADGVDLLGGAITADVVSRSARDSGGGPRYSGSIRGLKIADRDLGDVKRATTYSFDAGTVTVNTDGAGLRVELSAAVGAAPAGTEIVVADVQASARDGAKATSTPTATPTATATPTPTAAPKRKPPTPAYVRRLRSGDFVFPVRGQARIGGPFGALRSDTGSHQGNDVFAAFGTPVVAVADGTVRNVGSLPISGNRLWVYADTGDRFFYAHLSAFAPQAVDGAHVKAGTLLGYVGNTGDAEPTPPHVHFEIHPDGGKAVDPHPFLVRWQARMGDATADTAERPGALVEIRDFIGEG